MNIIDRLQRPRGFLTLNIYERGKLIETWDGENVIVSQARGQTAKLWGGDAENRSVTQIGFGTSGSTPSTGNTTLTGAYVKLLDAVTYPTVSSVAFEFSLSTAEANGLSIYELGLLTGAGLLVARRVRTAPLPKTSGIALSGIWRIEF